jgi:ketosteroid isomerase-like protein
MDRTHLVAQLTSRVLAKDADACAKCYTEDAELVSSAGTVKGRAEIRDWFETWFKSYSDLENSEELTNEGDEVFCIGVNHLTHTAPTVLPNGEKLEATGRRIKIVAEERYSFDGDLIKKHLMSWDANEMVSQLTGSIG